MSWTGNWRLLLTANLHSHTYTCPCIHTPYTLTQCEVVRRASPSGTDLKSQLHRRPRQELLVLRSVWAWVSKARLGNLGCPISESKRRAGDNSSVIVFAQHAWGPRFNPSTTEKMFLWSEEEMREDRFSEQEELVGREEDVNGELMSFLRRAAGKVLELSPFGVQNIPWDHSEVGKVSTKMDLELGSS